MKIFTKITLLFIASLFMSQIAFAQLKSVKMPAVEKIIQEKGDKILILNVWATFCKPCIEEIPTFVKFAQAHNDVQLVFLSLDIKDAFPKIVNQYIDKLKMTATNLWLNETNADYFVPKLDENWSGAIPASLIINTATGARKFVDGEMSEAELNEAYDLIKSSK
jgi:thiol-disulfide isomerase/thioredoxin